MTYVWMALIGFVVGLIARAVMPGTQSMGLFLTSLLGIAGAFIAGFLGQAIGFYAPGQPAGFIASVVGALILLFVVGLVKKGGSSS